MTSPTNLDGRRLAVDSGGAGSVLASHRGLVDAGEHDLTAHGGRADDGPVTSGQAGGIAVSLGPGQSIHQHLQ